MASISVAKFAKYLQKRIYQCVFCDTVTHELKLLNCSHPSCKGCFEKQRKAIIPKTEKSGGDNGLKKEDPGERKAKTIVEHHYVQCVQCQQTTRDPWTKLPRHFLLSTQRLVTNLVERRECRCKKPYDDSKEYHVCMACFGELYCERCLAIHNALPASKQHTVIPYEDVHGQHLRIHLQSRNVPELFERCTIHRLIGKRLTHWCKGCLKFVCEMCVAAKHQGHSCDTVAEASHSTRTTLHAITIKLIEAVGGLCKTCGPLPSEENLAELQEQLLSVGQEYGTTLDMAIETLVTVNISDWWAGAKEEWQSMNDEIDNIRSLGLIVNRLKLVGELHQRLVPDAHLVPVADFLQDKEADVLSYYEDSSLEKLEALDGLVPVLHTPDTHKQAVDGSVGYYRVGQTAVEQPPAFPTILAANMRNPGTKVTLKRVGEITVPGVSYVTGLDFNWEGELCIVGPPSNIADFAHIHIYDPEGVLKVKLRHMIRRPYDLKIVGQTMNIGDQNERSVVTMLRDGEVVRTQEYQHNGDNINFTVLNENADIVTLPNQMPYTSIEHPFPAGEEVLSLQTMPTLNLLTLTQRPPESKKFDPTWLLSMVEANRGPIAIYDDLLSPMDVCCDSRSNIYVTEQGTGEVIALTPPSEDSGTHFITTLPLLRCRDYDMNNIELLAVSKDDRFLAVSHDKNRVSVFVHEELDQAAS